MIQMTTPTVTFGVDAGMINNLINDYGNHWVPAPGYKYVSDGTIWTDSIFLGATDSIERWHGTNEEPPEEDEV